MRRIISFTLGGSEVPSSNFRMRCYYSLIEKAGFLVKEINAKKVLQLELPPIPKINAVVNILGLKPYFINKNKKKVEREVIAADIIWVNKVLKPEILAIIKKHNKKIILDIDDAIWISAEEIVQQNLDLAHTVVVGNAYLKEEVAKRFSGRIEVIPTTVDTQNYPAEPISRENEFKIGWIGSSYTNQYLYEVAPAINAFLEKYPDTSFEIISSDFASLKPKFPRQTAFIEWDPRSYIDTISRFSVGIMPMPNTEWVKGKCSFKMLQYMAAYVPVIVSPYGMNKDVLEQGECGFGAETQEEWFGNIEKLYLDKKQINNLGIEGRRIIEEKYSTQKNFKALLDLFQSI